MTGANLQSIQWYFSASDTVNIFGSDVVEITNSSKYALQETSTGGMLGVRLTVNDLDEDKDTGTYWCRAFLLDGTMLFSPNFFKLNEMSEYVGEFACGEQLVIKSSMSVCARPLVHDDLTTSPMPMPSPSPITGTVFSTTEGGTETLMPTLSTSSRLMSVLYVVIGLVAFLSIAICLVFVLGFVICLRRKCIRDKRKCIYMLLKLIVFLCRIQSHN